MMGFGEAVATCFRKYFTFSGRARRPEYWWFVLFYVLGALGSVFLVGGVVGPDAGALVYGLFVIVIFIPYLAVTWRRLHDVGYAGYWVLMPLYILLGAAVIVGLAFAAGVINQEQIQALETGADPEPALIAIGGLFVIAYLASIIISLVVFVWTLLGSQKGPNRFGPEPGADVAVDGVFD